MLQRFRVVARSAVNRSEIVMKDRQRIGIGLRSLFFQSQRFVVGFLRIGVALQFPVAISHGLKLANCVLLSVLYVDGQGFTKFGDGLFAFPFFPKRAGSTKMRVRFLDQGGPSTFLDGSVGRFIPRFGVAILRFASFVARRIGTPSLSYLGIDLPEGNHEDHADDPDGFSCFLHEFPPDRHGKGDFWSPSPLERRFVERPECRGGCGTGAGKGRRLSRSDCCSDIRREEQGCASIPPAIGRFPDSTRNFFREGGFGRNIRTSSPRRFPEEQPIR